MKSFLMVPALVLVMGMGAFGARAEEPGMGMMGGMGKGGMHPMKCMHDAFDKLPPEKAALFKDGMKKHHEEMGSQREKMKAVYGELKELLKAEKFDRDAYIAKSKEVHAMRDEMHTKRITSFADAAAQLTVEERRTLADARSACWEARRQHKGPEGGEGGAQDNGDE